MSPARLPLALVAAALLAVPSTAAAQQIDGQYIVVLKSQSSSAQAQNARERARARGGRIQHEFGTVLKGFSAKLDKDALDAVEADPAVAYVEPDQVMTVDTTQSPATWGLDRIDQRDLPLNNAYTYDADGSGVKAYIIDTGIRFDHTQFGGRASSGYDAVDGGSADDCNGHGTHVAGTVGGSTYGVAKNVRLVAVRVLGCNGSGSTSGVIAGINWVTQNHSGPSVANMSLGGGASSALDQAVQGSIASGVTYAVAAGNDNANACNGSPARVAQALTVGATTSGDARASFSNYGSCVDLFAPGQSITSAWYTSSSATNTISGTSMATPHVTGAAALYLQSNPSASALAVQSALVGAATQNRISNPGSGSPNLLLYTGSGGSTPPPPPPPPPNTCGQTFTGSLSSGAQQSPVSYTSAASGTHSGCLTGPGSADFDLYLQKRSGSRWVTVARGIGNTATENVTYNGTAGTYRWVVVSYRGSGSYTLGISHP